jgi:hypothetical protein
MLSQEECAIVRKWLQDESADGKHQLRLCVTNVTEGDEYCELNCEALPEYVFEIKRRLNDIDGEHQSEIRGAETNVYMLCKYHEKLVRQEIDVWNALHPPFNLYYNQALKLLVPIYLESILIDPLVQLVLDHLLRLPTNKPTIC